jgi:integrase
MTIKTLSAPEKGQRTYFDETVRGFGVRVSQGGTRTFVLMQGADRQLVSIGRYPIISLSDARAEAKRMLAERTLGRHRPQSVPYAEAKDAFLALCEEKNRPHTVYDYKRALERRFNFGARQLADITPHDIHRKLDVIRAPQEREYAAVVGKMFFRWAVRRHYIEHSPCDSLPGRKTTSRSRVLSDHELKRVWTAAKEMNGSFGTIVRLLILTGQRRGEIAALQKLWINLDDSTITLPAEITKNRREHTFPIGSISQSILTSRLHKDTPSFLFLARNSNTSSPKSFSGWSKSKALLDKMSGVQEWTLHDLRRTCASQLAALGVQLPVIERLLNHVSGSFGGIVAVYQRHSFMPEMRSAIEKWEAHLSGLLKSE